jgi:predicted dithiol-disulfide oxidoreductase (DUF899 family)
MATFRFPNESDEYRARRNELLELEKDIRARVDAAAKKRRELPLGGRLKEDYRFERLDAGGPDGEVEEVHFEELFGDHRSLLLYTMMFGPDWDAACPSCTNIVDGLNATYYPVSQRCAMAVVSAARPAQLRDWARRRGWTLPLYSAGKTRYILDYFAREDTTNPAMVTMMNAFRRTPEGIFHTWGSELVGHPKENGHPCHVDAVWPYWNLLDMTPDGRGEASVPIQNYEHVYFSRNVLGEED